MAREVRALLEAAEGLLEDVRQAASVNNGLSGPNLVRTTVGLSGSFAQYCSELAEFSVSSCIRLMYFLLFGCVLVCIIKEKSAQRNSRRRLHAHERIKCL